LFPREATIPLPGADLPVGPPGAFRDVALTTLGRLNMAGLRPDHAVLDVGCGVGRIARYLCDYLERGSRYEGFDVRESVVSWCQTQITPRFPNFRFQFTPLFNTLYNPDPTLHSAANFVFPYADRSFDFVFAHSVFTHLTPDAASNYLGQVSRVSRPGGISYCTWFIFNQVQGAYSHPFTREMTKDASGTFAMEDSSVPEVAIGYSEQTVRDAYRSRGLRIVEPIHFGFERLQDVVVAVRD